MRTVRFLGPALLLFGCGLVCAEPPRPDPARDNLPRQVEAVRAMRLALEDLPPGKEADQIREAIEKLRTRLTDEFKLRVKRVEADLEIARDNAAWSDRMVKKGDMTPGMADDARARVDAGKDVLGQLQEGIRLLGDDAIKGALARQQKERADDVRGQMKLVEADVEQWKDRAAWSDRMVKKGYFTPNQAKADRLRLERAEDLL